MFDLLREHAHAHNVAHYYLLISCIFLAECCNNNMRMLQYWCNFHHKWATSATLVSATIDENCRFYEIWDTLDQLCCAPACFVVIRLIFPFWSRKESSKMHSFSFIFVAFTEAIVRRILIINNVMKVSRDHLPKAGLIILVKLDLGLALIKKSECESLMILAFILLNITSAVWVHWA